jgi:hypothetical protein
MTTFNQTEQQRAEMATRARESIMTIEQMVTFMDTYLTSTTNRLAWLKTTATNKNVYRSTQWTPAGATEDDVKWAMDNIILHQTVVQKKEPVPVFDAETLQSMHLETLRMLGHLRNLKGYEKWTDKKDKHTMVNSIMNDQGNVPYEEKLKKMLKDRLVIEGHKWGINSKLNKKPLFDAILAAYKANPNGMVQDEEAKEEGGRLYTREELEEIGNDEKNGLKQLKAIGTKLHIEGTGGWRRKRIHEHINELLTAQDGPPPVVVAEPVQAVAPTTTITLKVSVGVLEKMSNTVLRAIADEYKLDYEGAKKASVLNPKLIKKIIEASTQVMPVAPVTNPIDVHEECRRKLEEAKIELDLAYKALQDMKEEQKIEAEEAGPIEEEEEDILADLEMDDAQEEEVMFAPMSLPKPPQPRVRAGRTTRIVTRSIEEADAFMEEKLLELSPAEPEPAQVIPQVPSNAEYYRGYKRYPHVRAVVTDKDQFPGVNVLFDDADPTEFDGIGQTIQKCLGVDDYTT